MKRSLHAELRKTLNPDAAESVQQSYRGDCRKAFESLYHAAPHVQARCGTDKFEAATRNFTTAANVFSKMCLRGKRVLDG